MHNNDFIDLQKWSMGSRAPQGSHYLFFEMFRNIELVYYVSMKSVASQMRIRMRPRKPI
jgi:hypothetical protein